MEGAGEDHLHLHRLQDHHHVTLLHLLARLHEHLGAIGNVELASDDPAVEHEPHLALPADAERLADVVDRLEFLAELDEKGTNYRIVDHIDEDIAEADVIYMEPVVQPDYTQARQDKQEVYARTAANYQVTQEVMKKAKGSSIILHSLPRRDELLPEVDDSKHARYWQEAYNGVVMRMALLALVLGAVE